MKYPFSPFDKEAEIQKSQRNLPHWQQPGATYFVTFRTCDSLPQSKITILSEQKENWLEQHPKPWDTSTKDEYHHIFSEQVNEWLDAGYGECLLKEPSIGKVIESSLLHFDTIRYLLDAYVIMPNHVHVLVCPLEEFSLRNILHGWKSYTAHQINKTLNRTGSLWMDERFDHGVRSYLQLEKFRHYIRENPVKAGLKPGNFIIGTGSGVG